MTADDVALLLPFPSVTTANPSTRGRRALRVTHAHTDVLRLLQPTILTLQMVRLRNSWIYSPTVFVFTVFSWTPKSQIRLAQALSESFLTSLFGVP